MEGLLSAEPFRRGIDLFNHAEFYVCHEVLEDLWRPERGPNRLFLQALIHFAVAFHHQQQGNPLGAERQLRKALRKLAGYLPEFEGVATAVLYREGQVCLERILRNMAPGEFPRITLAGQTLYRPKPNGSQC